MATSDIAAAMDRVTALLRRRPHSGMADDTPAVSTWQGGLRVVARSPGGAQVATDMPQELGGSGDLPSPGWLVRAALASCAVTRIAMAAAEAGIELHVLEASAHSRSDARGLFGLPDIDGSPLPAGPVATTLRVRIGAAGVAPQRLRSLVDQAIAMAPVSQALARPVPAAVEIEIAPA